MIPRIVVERGAEGWPGRAVVRALARRVRRAARAMGCTRVELDALSLRLCDDARMRVLKAQALGVAEATDVLSFPAGDAIPGDELHGPSLGEVVINRDAVARQAARPGTAGWLDEATALAIHGVAHLRGHDHDRRDRARHMLACERRGSRAVGLPCVRPYGGPPVRPISRSVAIDEGADFDERDDDRDGVDARGDDDVVARDDDDVDARDDDDVDARDDDDVVARDDDDVDDERDDVVDDDRDDDVDDDRDDDVDDERDIVDDDDVDDRDDERDDVVERDVDERDDDDDRDDDIDARDDVVDRDDDTDRDDDDTPDP